MVKSTTPSTSGTAKRKTPVTAPNARKRPRTSLGSNERPTSKPRRSRQQTLTQIQFVANWSPSSSDLKRKSVSTLDAESDDLRPSSKKLNTESEGKQGGKRIVRRASIGIARDNATHAGGKYHQKLADHFDEDVHPANVFGGDQLAAYSEAEPDQTRLVLGVASHGSEALEASQLAKLAPVTPRKQRSVIPSSQSPENLSTSPQKPHTPNAKKANERLQRWPLAERSANVQVTQVLEHYKELSPTSIRNLSPLKRKICTLRLPPRSLREADVKRRPSRESRERCDSGPPSSSPTKAAKGSHDLAPAREVKHSVTKDEEEIPETSPVDGNEALPLSPVVFETQEMSDTSSGRLMGQLTNMNVMPMADKARNLRLKETDVVADDFATGAVEKVASGTPEGHAAPLESNKWESQNAIVQPTANEDDDDGVALSPGSSVENDTQFIAELASRIPSSSPVNLCSPSKTPITPAKLHSSQQQCQGSPFPIQAHSNRHTSARSDTTTILLNDLSSPTLPSRLTRWSSFPASLLRPSQISTQDPTQPYLPMSSVTHSSSPPHQDTPKIHLKSSSSAPHPLYSIPLHAQSQTRSNPNIDLSLDGGEDDFDEDLDSASQTVMLVEENKDSRLGREPIGDIPVRFEAESNERSKRARRPPKAFVESDVRALLSESILESIPGPPGWSQSSWDDEPITANQK